MESMLVVLMFVSLAFLAFLPTVIASHRHHVSTMAIGVCNLVGLFTGIFWLVALVWSFTGNVKQQ